MALFSRNRATQNLQICVAFGAHLATVHSETMAEMQEIDGIDLNGN